MVELLEFPGPRNLLHSRVKLDYELDGPGFISRQRQSFLQKHPDLLWDPLRLP
jgi:hypothetical protein